MSKHTLRQSMAEQINNKGYASAPFYRAALPIKVAFDNDSIQLRAYQIHQEKGGSDLDNWLEAEKILKNDDQSSGK